MEWTISKYSNTVSNVIPICAYFVINILSIKEIWFFLFTTTSDLLPQIAVNRVALDWVQLYVICQMQQMTYKLITGNI
jgi:hypothetical protein